MWSMVIIEYSQFLPPVPGDMADNHSTYLYVIISQYIATIIALKSYVLDELRVRKLKKILTFIYSFI